MIGTLRIGGDDVGSERGLTATTADERIALVDRLLRRASVDPIGDVIHLEIDRTGDGFAALDRYREVVDGSPVEAPELIEFMRVGVAGQFGAAEHVVNRLGSGQRAVRTTYNASPVQRQVLYDTHVPTYFRSEAVLPLDAIRALMIDFATTGEWSDSASWRVTTT
ncbi:Imm1 family immunity protein [Labedaea rhizosphaerae]|uniref:Immunity protein Imm1 of predicted polymorphic toxin system n=1 Tax=Labedaea rhizosphaerae TaxID=598644 RepID=A0A4R6S226_LABRH|nr:Imm1 family immunity protein [Labedaea rhizosphaerae]TDP93649.1 immunity protein Imm1 of predicted polymorphic toxin system [Labedaea rhizosphaerae]